MGWGLDLVGKWDLGMDIQRHSDCRFISLADVCYVSTKFDMIYVLSVSRQCPG